MSPCAVQRCMREAVWPVKLKEPGEVSATFIAVEVCDEHREPLRSKSLEWVLEIGQDPINPRWWQQTLIVGDDLRALDEYVVKGTPVLKNRPDLYSRTLQ